MEPEPGLPMKMTEEGPDDRGVIGVPTTPPPFDRHPTLSHHIHHFINRNRALAPITPDVPSPRGLTGAVANCSSPEAPEHHRSSRA